MADAKRLRDLADRVMAAWTGQDVDEVLSTYAPEFVYLDPNTRGPITERQAFRSYLTKLFGRWDQSWRAEDVYPLDGPDGAAVRWDGVIRPKGSDRGVAVNGIDIVILDGDLITWNQVSFDRAPLAALLTSTR